MRTNPLPKRIRVTADELLTLRETLRERKRLQPVERTGFDPGEIALQSWEGALRYAAVCAWQDAPWLVIFGGLAWVGVLIL